MEKANVGVFSYPLNNLESAPDTVHRDDAFINWLRYEVHPSYVYKCFSTEETEGIAKLSKR